MDRLTFTVIRAPGHSVTVLVTTYSKEPTLTDHVDDPGAEVDFLDDADLESEEDLQAFLRTVTRGRRDGETVHVGAWRSAVGAVLDLYGAGASSPDRTFTVELDA